MQREGDTLGSDFVVAPELLMFYGEHQIFRGRKKDANNAVRWHPLRTRLSLLSARTPVCGDKGRGTAW